jgi:uncharacterized protein YndB with AHSA1/START domain
MPQDKGSINLAWELPHAPAKIWKVLTDPQLVGQWLMKTDMPAERGKAFTFRAEPMPYWDGIIHSEIVELEPQRRLSYTWKGGPGALGLDTVVTWTLVPMDGGTRLELEHRGFQEAQGQAFGGAKLGWQGNVGKRMSELLKSLD